MGRHKWTYLNAVKNNKRINTFCCPQIKEVICLLLWDGYIGIDKDLRNSQLKLKYKANQETALFKDQNYVIKLCFTYEKSYVQIKWSSCSLS